MLRLTLIGTASCGATMTMPTLRAKYGATTVCALSGWQSGSSTYGIRFVFELSALNSASAQIGSGMLVRGANGSDSGTSTAAGVAHECHGTAAEASASDKALTITIQNGTTAQTFVCKVVHTELI
jgi:hypothetical protein